MVRAPRLYPDPGNWVRSTRKQSERRWWGMLIDLPKCIGCGNCVRACQAENDVPDGYFRTWVERYHVSDYDIENPQVDSPEGGKKGFPPAGWKRALYSVMTLGSTNISERALAIDEKAGWLITVIGIPSAFLLHGYVGFIFGSIKANPWWSTPLMPVVFIFSAMVSGIALVMLLYMLISWARRQVIDMKCVDTVARYLFYIFVIDFSLEMLDLIHRIYEADESFRSLDFMVHSKLYLSHIVVQIALGTIAPIALLGLTQVAKLSDIARKRIYAAAGCLALMGIFAMRWNVVIGGQLFSKSFLAYTTYKMGLVAREGLLMAILFTILPFAILWVLVKVLPPWPEASSGSIPDAEPAR
jgi:Ni/Fe-hydrogenase subunit HybB-like protein